jgi:hypothetical protein
MKYFENKDFKKYYPIIYDVFDKWIIDINDKNFRKGIFINADNNYADIVICGISYMFIDFYKQNYNDIYEQILNKKVMEDNRTENLLEVLIYDVIRDYSVDEKLY